MLTDATKTQMLAAFTATQVRLHSADPTASGTENEITGGGYTRLTPVYEPVDADTIDITPLQFSGLGLQTVWGYSVWDGETLKAVTALTSGDTAFNAAGEFILQSAAISLTE